MKATLNGTTLLNSSAVRWSEREGVSPVIETFDLTPGDATALLSAGSLTLLIESERSTLRVQDLRPISIVSSGHPHISRLMVADQRFFWSYRHVRRVFNWRRVVGVKRLTDPETLELQPLVDDVSYAPWSMEDGLRPWTPARAAAHVLREVIDGDVPDTEAFRSVPIENLELDDDGGAAVQRILSYLPGAGITVGLDGRVRLFSKVDGGDAYVSAITDGELAGFGHLQVVDRRRIRPSKIVFLFGREHEIRFDFEEATGYGASVADPNDAERVVDNVLPTPDFSLELSDGRTVAQGTWITFSEALSAWAATPPPILGALDYQDIQRAMIPFVDLWSGIGLCGLMVKEEANANWAQRIGAIQQHYRTTFRIRREWMDRIANLRAYRVALLDAETGARGPAVAYADFAWLSSARSLYLAADAERTLAYATNVPCYPRSGTISSRDAPAPCRVSVADEDQGIVHLDYLGDPFGIRGQVLPSMVEMEGTEYDENGIPISTPMGDLKRAQYGEPITYNAILKGAGRAYPKLTSSHRVAVILTATPGSPNSNEQLFPVEVTPDQISSLLPSASQAGLQNAEGPVMYVRIGSATETARVAWKDDEDSVLAIEQAFGVKKGPAKIDDLIVNLDRTGVGSGASLRAIARAAAARIYASMADRLEGSAAFDLAPGLTLRGWIRSIEHELSPDGMATSRVSLPEGETPRLSMWTFLDANTRAVVLKLAKTGKG